MVCAELDLERAVPVPVGASSAVEVDVDVFEAEREPVDAAVEQSISDGALRCRAPRQVLVCQYGDPLRILIRHSAMVGRRRGVFLGLIRVRSWSLIKGGLVVCRVVAGGAVAEYPDQGKLEDGEDPVEVQVVCWSFGFHRCSRQNRWAAATSARWWWKPFQLRPSKSPRPRACSISR